MFTSRTTPPPPDAAFSIEKRRAGTGPRRSAAHGRFFVPTAIHPGMRQHHYAPHLGIPARGSAHSTAPLPAAPHLLLGLCGGSVPDSRRDGALGSALCFSQGLKKINKSSATERQRSEKRREPEINKGGVRSLGKAVGAEGTEGQRSRSGEARGAGCGVAHGLTAPRGAAALQAGMHRVIARGAARTLPPSRRSRHRPPLCPTDPLPPHGLRAGRGAGRPQRGGGCAPRLALGREGGGESRRSPPIRRTCPVRGHPRGVENRGCVHVREPGSRAATGRLLRETRGNSGLRLAMQRGVRGKMCLLPRGAAASRTAGT